MKRLDGLRYAAQGFIISLAIYPIVMVAVWGLVALGAYATNAHMPTDTMPLVYGLVFAVLTVALIDILGVASALMALVACANLIEYAQIFVPGRSASAIDFIAGLGGVVVAALLVWITKALMKRNRGNDVEEVVI